MSDQASQQISIIDMFRDIERELTADGAPFETTDIRIAGRPVRTYRRSAANFYGVLAEFETRFADNVLTVVDETCTYAEVFARARRFAVALYQRHGIAPGDRVGIMMANQTAYLVALIAITRLGATAVLYNSRSSAAEIASATTDVPSAVIVADPARIEILRTVNHGAALISTHEAGDPRTPAIDTVIAETIGEGARCPVPTDSVCAILFTSGTSGRAKGVQLTHRNLGNLVLNMQYVAECNLRIAARRYGLGVEDVRAFMPPVSALLIFPLFHVSGLSGLLSTMSSGGRIATMTRWNPAIAADLVHRHQLTLMSGPPMTVDELLQQPDAHRQLASLVNITPGGQATPPNLTGRIAATVPGAQRSSGWGMTETAGSVCTAGGALLAAFPDTVGPMSPTMEVRVTGPDGREMGSRTVGELELRGGLIMAGYLDADGSTTTDHQPWLRTGDLGYLDEHGLVYVVDRNKDIVISAGENISCAEIEAALMVGDEFTEVAAFGVPDKRLGERLVVAVTPGDGRSLDAEGVKELARQSLPGYKVPTEVLFDMSPLPRNATGKLLKRDLRARYSEREEVSRGGTPA
ncbi:class I adenylate-forming enzyme family protein [Nocardia macrotermitis]|uniref:Long-chain-fatty-acid--CoA ligase n=1 Tax=Nocardia macrotermitis TaxID=2585198 RepID=A0A7K0D5D7_9NOCA|nr:class I adenylate-forming enzyme family protein [Nocardia macrotermitis]MQY20966.1 Long-chain-fatty-acid--CoA ligase [Nocardia macrotermitis]